MRRSQWVAVVAAATLGAWLSYWLGGHWAARCLADRFGPALERVSKGKIADVRLFIEHRLGEGLWLVSTLMVLGCLFWMLGWVLGRLQVKVRWRWIGHAVLGLISANVLLGMAGRTALFWALMWQGENTHSLAQFHFKRVLMEELHAPQQAVLLGSSQARAEIDENRLNVILGKRLWTTELHYPGTRASDLLLVARRLKDHSFTHAICYLSEMNFYIGSHSEPLPFFLTVGDCFDFGRLGGWHFIAGRAAYYGLLGQVLPAFRYRDVLAQRVLGLGLHAIQQRIYDASLAADLEARAQVAAKTYVRGPESEFQKRIFEQFILECGAHGRRLILCCGQLNPILARKLDPSIRLDLRQFLQRMKEKYPGVVFLDEHSLPEQTIKDYVDLTHVTPEAQAIFTERLGTLIEPMVTRD